MKTFLITLLLISGCSSGPKYIKKDFFFPGKVAVLPFRNETNDLTGPEIVRKNLNSLLNDKGYHPIDQKHIDKVLQEEFGINDGGQLRSVTHQEIGNALGVDGLFYGNLITFIDLPLGFARKRKVKANLKLVDAITGELLWEDEKSWSNPEIHLSAKEAKKAAVRQTAERQIAKMTGTFLKAETILMLRLALKNLPTPKK